MSGRATKKTRWRVNIEGHPLDLRIAGEHFFGFVTETRDEVTETFLALSAHDAIDSAGNVRSEAKEYVAKVNACLQLYSSECEPLTVGYVQEMYANGRPGPRHIYLTAESITCRTHLSATLTTGRTTQEPRTLPNRALHLSEQDDEFADALRLFCVGSHDYRILYIVLEYARHAVAPCEKAKSQWETLEARPWVNASLLKRFKATAHNLHRHKPIPVEDELPLKNAQSFIRQVLQGWLNEKMPN